jgi:hypothetical protein
MLSQIIYSLSHRSLYATNNSLGKSQKDGAVSTLAIPLQPLSPLPARKHEELTREMKKSGRWHRLQGQKPFSTQNHWFYKKILKGKIIENLPTNICFLIKPFTWIKLTLNSWAPPGAREAPPNGRVAPRVCAELVCSCWDAEFKKREEKAGCSLDLE